MFVNVQIPDEVFQRYADKSPDRPQRLMAEVLKAFVDLDPAAHRLVLEGPNLKKLNELLEWPIDSEATLLSRVAKFKQVAVPKLGLSLELSEGQLLALKSQADFWNAAGKASSAELVDFCRKQLLAGISKVVGP